MVLLVRLAMRFSRDILPLQAEVLVDHEMAGGRVNGSGYTEEDDDACGSYEYGSGGVAPRGLSRWLTEGNQLGWDLPQTSQALRDRVRCESTRFVSACRSCETLLHSSPCCRSMAPRTSLLLLLHIAGQL